MDVSYDGDAGSGQALADTATQARELAQQRIVEAFRAFLGGWGSGPTDTELQIFAKLAVVEHALHGDYLARMSSAPLLNVSGASRAA